MVWDRSGVRFKTPSDPREVLLMMGKALDWPEVETHLGTLPRDENAWRRFIEDAPAEDVIQVGLDLETLWTRATRQ
jgi:hypothetical protein